MQALILHNNPEKIASIGRALTRSGFFVSTSSDQERACRFVQENIIDLLVLAHEIDGRHTTSVALAAEHHNPRNASILLTKRPRNTSVELFELLPSLQAILPMDANAGLIAQLGLQAVRNPGEQMLVLSPSSRLSPLSISARPPKVA